MYYFWCRTCLSKLTLYWTLKKSQKNGMKVNHFRQQYQWYDENFLYFLSYISWYLEIEEQVCSVCPSLTFQQRITGCLICLLVGFLLSMGSTFRLIKLLEGDPEPFAIMYTIGNVIGLCSTCFLYGPWSQMKKMFAPTRYKVQY